MDTMQAIRAAASASGTPTTKIGPALGLTASAVSNAASRGSTPRADTLASWASVCGYALALVPADELPAGAIVIDPARVATDDTRRAALESERAALERRLARVDEELIG